jgi:hypothetical protein
LGLLDGNNALTLSLLDNRGRVFYPSQHSGISISGGVDMNLNAIKAIIWVMLGCGFTMMMMPSDIRTVGIIGRSLIAIALLWRLLLFLREREPNLQRIEAAAETPVGVLGIDSLSIQSAGFETPIAPSTTHRADGLSPVQRLFDDEASKR